eukprot:CAMPEP_0119323198 /NCGR_PEP_ID=MMETSP1333-20130426/60256_1 /TAXON_ID=418940 /ORGANISM="Scyphosphaera apsteinii, Strain RCC1455" /LENGTH=737 /DNA_ID=CAMNT_0007330591 /DNA_START=15 /DNA_END=2228 /DNA_ORIENTATION=+
MPIHLRRLAAAEVPSVRRDPVDPQARAVAEPIVEAVRNEGEAAVRRYAEQFGELKPGAPMLLHREVELKAAWDAITPEQRLCLIRTQIRVQAFAKSQLTCTTEVTVPIPGGQAGHTVAAVDAAGCYAPGGRYPLPSTVLMTAVTARVAGCTRVVVASPKPSPVTLAAAYIAEADVLLPIGGAHAIAALSYGLGELLAPCDAVVGPGNMYVTAAKSLVAGRVAIDMLAGPSECLVIADDRAKPTIVAADLLAQAEHDPSALPALICLSEAFADKVDDELATQLEALPTRDIAQQALQNGYAVVVPDLSSASEISDRLAVEHVELHVEDAMGLAKTLKHYGALFVGEGAAEVLGDYGAGPNHTLPTGGTARSYGGLSVFTFLRVRTWMSMTNAVEGKQTIKDAVQLGELEGLFGHAQAAAARLPSKEEDVPVNASQSVCTKGWDTTASRLHIAVPKKGRMHETCLRFLEAAGLEYKRPERVDLAEVTNMPITLVFLPAADIAQYVGEGNVDLGITGEDIVAETGVSVTTEMTLNFGKCRLSVLVPKEKQSVSIEAYAGARIVTSFMNVAKKFFDPLDANASVVQRKDVKTQLRYVSGSVEAACKLGLADAVVDLVETGTTMRAAGLCELMTIMETQAVLISNPKTPHGELVAKIKQRIQGYLDSIKYVFMQYNIARANLHAAVKVTPGKKSPTILPLEEASWVAVSAMVKKNEVPDVIDELTSIGATDILVFKIDNCRV